MSEQAQIIAQMQTIIMSILKTGSATPQEGNQIDVLEAKLFEQKCYQSIDHPECDCKGEEIATLFFNDKYEDAIKKMQAYEITPEDFFGFVDYHYDEDEDEEIEIFTQTFRDQVLSQY